MSQVDFDADDAVEADRGAGVVREHRLAAPGRAAVGAEVYVEEVLRCLLLGLAHLHVVEGQRVVLFARQVEAGRDEVAFLSRSGEGRLVARESSALVEDPSAERAFFFHGPSDGREGLPFKTLQRISAGNQGLRSAQADADGVASVGFQGQHGVGCSVEGGGVGDLERVFFVLLQRHLGGVEGGGEVRPFQSFDGIERQRALSDVPDGDGFGVFLHAEVAVEELVRGGGAFQLRGEHGLVGLDEHFVQPHAVAVSAAHQFAVQEGELYGFSFIGSQVDERLVGSPGGPRVFHAAGFYLLLVEERPDGLPGVASVGGGAHLYVVFRHLGTDGGGGGAGPVEFQLVVAVVQRECGGDEPFFFHGFVGAEASVAVGGFLVHRCAEGYRLPVVDGAFLLVVDGGPSGGWEGVAFESFFQQ